MSYMKKKLIAIKKLIMSPGKHVVLFSKVLPLFMKCNIPNCGAGILHQEISSQGMYLKVINHNFKHNFEK